MAVFQPVFHSKPEHSKGFQLFFPLKGGRSLSPTGLQLFKPFGTTGASRKMHKLKN